MGKEDERVVVIDKKVVFSKGVWIGVNSLVLEDIVKLVTERGYEKRRGDVEDDPSVKQIGSYVVFRNAGNYFLMQRRETHSDLRLASKYSIGIGGHLISEDINTGSVDGWVRREFTEEVDYKGKLTLKVLGAIYDSSDAVGRVHLGVVLLAEGDSADITLKSEHKKGSLVSPKELNDFYPQMENWSKLVIDFLRESGEIPS